MSHQGTDLHYGANIIMESGTAGIGVVEFDTGAGIGALSPLRFPATPLIEVDWSHRGRRLLLDDSETNEDVTLPEIAVGWADGYWLEIANVGGDDVLITPSENDTIAGNPDYTLPPGQVLRLMAEAGEIDWHCTVSTTTSAVGPYAGIRTSEMYGLTGRLISESYGVGLDYVWSAPLGGLTFASPNANDTYFSATTPGSYVAMLAVTDSEGKGDTYEITISVDRVLYVNGVDEDTFTTLQSAINWINTNDVANDLLYSIHVNGVAADAIRIAPNRAHIHFEPGAQLLVGIDFTVAGTYTVTGSGGPASSSGTPTAMIRAASGAAITVSAAVVLRLESLHLGTADAAATILTSSAASVLYFIYGCYFGGSGVAAINVSNSPHIRLVDCTFIACGPVIISGTSGVVNWIRNCRFSASSNLNAIQLTDWGGEISNCQFYGAASSAIIYAISTNAPTSASALLSINNCSFRGSGAGASALMAAIQVLTGGAGAVRVLNNSIYVSGAKGVALHFVGTPPANVLAANNVLEGGMAAVLSTTDTAGATALALANAKLYNNTIAGLVTNVTFATGTVLSGDNVQV